MVTLVGTDKPETLIGTEQSDYIDGAGGDDHLIGLAGRDQLLGGGGADLLEGGLGDDLYQLYEDTTDTIIDTGGWDAVRSLVGRDLAQYPDVEALWMLVDFGGRPLVGNDLDNQLLDGGGGNRLDGRAGNDELSGSFGNDFLIGGLGVDYMFGGEGVDRFDFRNVAESGLGQGNRDIIPDFGHLEDRLNFGAMDANSARSGNQAFSFIGTSEFTGTAGELTYYRDVLSDGITPVTIVAGDTNGDGVADFELELRGTLTLTAADFIL